MNNDRLLFQVGERLELAQAIARCAWDKGGISVREAAQMNAHLRHAMAAGMELERRAGVFAAETRPEG